MSPARHQFRTRALTMTTAGVLAAGLALAAPTASAQSSQVSTPLQARQAVYLGATARALLGDRTIGSYYDSAGKRLIVTVTDDTAAAQVRTLGAVPAKVPFRASELATVTSQLGQRARIPGTAWRIDPRTGQVLVTADSTVTGATLKSLTTLVKEFGAKARMATTKGTLRPLIAGGDAIWGQGLRCSLGFNVHDAGGNPAILTAGHCGVATNDWWADGSDSQHIATTQAADFPGTDYSYAVYDQGVDAPSAVNTGQQIDQAGDATVGESVTRSGSTSGVHTGTVTGLNATVNYQEGSVSGLIDTDVCAEPGDSGGAMYDGDTALGLTSGGSGDCQSGGETFFQPVPAALNAYGLTLP